MSVFAGMGHLFGDEPSGKHIENRDEPDGEWVECYNCGGRGYFDDLQCIDPSWYGPDDTETCDVCKGDGGWLAGLSPSKEEG